MNTGARPVPPSIAPNCEKYAHPSRQPYPFLVMVDCSARCTPSKQRLSDRLTVFRPSPRTRLELSVRPSCIPLGCSLATSSATTVVSDFRLPTVGGSLSVHLPKELSAGR